MTDNFNNSPRLDNDGYLLCLSDWNEQTAHLLAQDEHIELTPAHWDIIHLVREFYDTYELSPSQRPLVKFIKEKLGADKGNSLYLMQLFRGSPAKSVTRIAGLPRPTNCF